MSRHAAWLVLGGALLTVSGTAPLAAPAYAKEATKVAPALDFKMKDIDGKDVPLAQYQGKVILVTNVASQ